MQSSITKLIPWLFKTPLSEMENELLRSLTAKKSDKYMELVYLFAKNYNFREDRINRLLSDFSNRHEKQRLVKLLHERDQNHSRFEYLQQQIAECITKENDMRVSILGIERALQQGDNTGLTDYFKCNKSLHLLNVKTESLNFMITTYLDYFDQSVFDRFLANHDSYFYRGSNGQAIDKHLFKNLLLAIYGDDSCIKVRVCAEFTLNLSGSLRPVQNSSMINNYPEWLPHPHIDGANCLGSNAMEINHLMMERRFIEAIEQAISATKNMNFADSVIGPRLIQALRTGAKRFLELPNGDVVSPSVAVKWLNASKESDLIFA